MNDLVRTSQNLGDIRFGIPENQEELTKPWAFYRALGVRRNAPRESIKRAYHEAAKAYHPDSTPADQQGVAAQRFQQLQHIAEVLLDDGGNLGPEHSRKAHYDTISRLEQHFGNFIQVGEERTQKLSEILLASFQVGRRSAERNQKLAEEVPGYAELDQRLQKLMEEGEGNSEEGKKVFRGLLNLRAKAMGGSPKDVQKMLKAVAKAQEQHWEETGTFAQDFLQDPLSYCQGKVVDIFYKGSGSITFVPPSYHGRTQMGLGGHEIGKNILRLLLGETCRLPGIQKMHCKAEKAEVRLEDPSLEGIVHVVEGSVSVDYEGAGYGKVVRVRAPEVEIAEGFVKEGNLYVPERFAEMGKRIPTLDIRVLQGKVSLRLRSQEFARMDPLLSYLSNYSDSIILPQTFQEKPSGIRQEGLENYIPPNLDPYKKRY